MSHELLFRTEDFKLDEMIALFVETSVDRGIVDRLKGRSPVILKGSRGVGKSFLLRVAEAELQRDFPSERILPVYMTFARAGLIRQGEQGFMPWMVSKVATAVNRAFTVYGLSLPAGSALAALLSPTSRSGEVKNNLETVTNQYEEFWIGDKLSTSAEDVPDPEALRDAIALACDDLGISRIVLLVDEAAHVFIPAQQREFFTFMRDMRSPYVAVKAAVYPGATAYGDSFQPSHDATVVSVERSIADAQYAPAMREMVYKQDAGRKKQIEQYGEAFDVLAFAASGNPRILLKTIETSEPFNRKNAQTTVTSYYREDVWAEHSTLADRYTGHRELIDWGRRFIEDDVLPAIHSRNQDRDSEMSSAIWVHRDAPQAVRESLRLLCYSGILQEGVSGVRATRSEVGTRYLVNFGCSIAQDAEPIAYGARLRKSFSLKRMQEFGANHSAYRGLETFDPAKLETAGNAALTKRLSAGISELDLTPFQKEKLSGLGFASIGDVLRASEDDFQKAHYVGQKRARQMRNAATMAVIEYLSG